ncbi:hypothetical protein vseg_010539 [Gypsophila vaccaria]
MAKSTTVIIVGAGPGGLATAACLKRLSIPYIILEREDCHAPLWKKHAYDRLHLHLAKQYAKLPYKELPDQYPKYVSKDDFVRYIDEYVDQFDIKPEYKTRVDNAIYDEDAKIWRVSAKKGSGEEEEEEYEGRCLVVASGEASDPYRPEIEGVEGFEGKVGHSREYKSGQGYNGKRVLVVGCGNSGMEIALDLANAAAIVSIVARSPVHILSRGMVGVGLFLLKHKVAYKIVDKLMVILSKVVYGDITKYGLSRPSKGPFYLKVAHGKYPLFDVGTFQKIRSREIQVLPGVKNIKGNDIMFEDGRSFTFDAIIFATGFKRSTHLWLQDDGNFLNEDGLPKREYPDHWKGPNGLYCAGLARRGIYGLTSDAINIADDINSQLRG